MLSLPEQVLFGLAVLVTLYATWRAVERLVKIISRGHGKVDWRLVRKRLGTVLTELAVMKPTFKLRPLNSLFHLLVVWGFTYYLLVNVVDVVQGYVPGFQLFGDSVIGGIYRFGGDVLSVAILASMVWFLVRRFVFKPENLTSRESTLLHPRARFGILRDSAIVGGFVLFHVGSRFLGESFALAQEGSDLWQPFASAVSSLWLGWNGLEIARHVTFWLALGSIMAFIPYFPYSKHVHLFFAPLNFLLKPERRSIGELAKIDFEDESLEKFGASRLEDLGWEQLMDAYACIMCYRCQEVCPAYTTGKLLSPAALEINKRYFLNFEGGKVDNGEVDTQALLTFAIPSEAVWACTACGACVDICPVNNEPMRDILDIRRSLVLMDNQFPSQLQNAFKGMERTMNPWGLPPNERMEWAQGLDVHTIEQNPNPDILWWVGCAPATDVRAQKTARAFARILNAGGVNYAVLGENEQCTGDSARRAGREDLFYQLAVANVETLNEVAPKRIVTTCPHCLHTLKNEYPAYGGNYQVIHHSQLIHELMAEGKLTFKSEGDKKRITYHDPCYLSRHNGITADPRSILNQTNSQFVELKRKGAKTFCCGAGGAQVWKEEEHGSERVSNNRFKEVQSANVDILAVGCPFCMTMLSDAAKDTGSTVDVLDLAEIIAERL